ncbi:hypothetical protein K431DRAFT_73330 [Polychaeton citri CBS 116435]|uniref:Uncharacterized protein n=1 Tax=Polychaeton citri CBS 116435 TaxID=1314669 RepID=A0A9P4QAG1_9PEZI|nr:hypothetical protein K431DRAFT_73330 [Polychaeton citri CBS 116435]
MRGASAPLKPAYNSSGLLQLCTCFCRLLQTRVSDLLQARSGVWDAQSLRPCGQPTHEARSKASCSVSLPATVPSRCFLSTTVLSSRI